MGGVCLSPFLWKKSYSDIQLETVESRAAGGRGRAARSPSPLSQPRGAQARPHRVKMSSPHSWLRRARSQTIATFPALSFVLTGAFVTGLFRDRISLSLSATVPSSCLYRRCLLVSSPRDCGLLSASISTSRKRASQQYDLRRSPLWGSHGCYLSF